MPLHDQVAFHCQQCVEKYLKALMGELGLAIPRTHDLQHLLNLLHVHHSSLQPCKRGLLFLTTFAVETRYPEEDTTKRQAQAALRWAKRVRQTARSLLGMRARPARRKKSP